jgi:general secretion pathway protein M
MRLSAWASRSAAVAILIAAVAALWLMLVQPLMGAFAEHRESIARSQEMLARYRGLDSARAQIDSNLSKLRAAQANEERLLQGGSAQLVGAKLQNRLKELIEGDGGALTSMQMLPVRDEQGFQRISMAVTLTASIESLQKILYAIEDQSPYLFIEDLELLTNQGFTDVSDGGEESRDLQVHFEVFGYLPARTQ